MKYAAKTYIGIPYKRLVTPGEILTEEEASALDIPGMLERGALVEVPRGPEGGPGGDRKAPRNEPDGNPAKESAEGVQGTTGKPPAETSLSPAGDISPFRGEGNRPEAAEGGPEGTKDGPEGGPGGDRKAPRNATRKKAAKKPAPAPDEKPVTQEAALSALTLDDRDMEESPAPAKKGGRKR